MTRAVCVTGRFQRAAAAAVARTADITLNERAHTPGHRTDSHGNDDGDPGNDADSRKTTIDNNRPRSVNLTSGIRVRNLIKTTMVMIKKSGITGT